jgi:hypothetical protein
MDSDDLCIMFKGAYTNEFYRAVRDALHAEVDSWRQPHSQAVLDEIKGRWRSVSDLEAISRHPQSAEPTTDYPTTPSSAFVALAELAPAAEG